MNINTLAAAQPDVFAEAAKYPAWFFPGIIGTIIIVSGLMLLGMATYEKKKNKKNGILMGALGLAIFIGSSIWGGVGYQQHHEDAAAANTALVHTAMERSVADTYKLELLDTPLVQRNSRARTDPAFSTFRTEDGQTIEFLLAFETETGRAILTDAAGDRLKAFTR